MTEQNPRVKISGLWANETKDGVPYFSGGNSNLRWTIWPNSFADKGGNQPTHILYVEHPKPKKDKGGGNGSVS